MLKLKRTKSAGLTVSLWKHHCTLKFLLSWKINFRLFFVAQGYFEHRKWTFKIQFIVNTKKDCRDTDTLKLSRVKKKCLIGEKYDKIFMKIVCTKTFNGSSLIININQNGRNQLFINNSIFLAMFKLRK